MIEITFTDWAVLFHIVFWIIGFWAVYHFVEWFLRRGKWE